MAILPAPFDANEHADLEEFQPLPPGEYLAAIVDSELKDSKSGGMRLVLRFRVLDGEHKGQNTIVGLNYMNANATAQQIAHRTLASICRAVGRQGIRDSSELHDRPMLVTFKLKPKTEQYGASNEIASVKPAPQVGHGYMQPPTSPAPQMTQPPQQAPTQSVAPPWGSSTASAAPTPPWGKR